MSWNKGKSWYKIKCNLNPSPELSYLLGVRYGDMRLHDIAKFSKLISIKRKQKKLSKWVQQHNRNYTYGGVFYSRNC
jgi:hypothetical protein